MKSIFVTFLVLLGCSLSLGCPTCPTPAAPTPSPSPVYVPSNSTVILPCPKSDPRCPKSWNYTTAPQWGSFCPSWGTCSQGKFQSPIDVYTPGHLPSRTPSSFLNNGHHYNEKEQANPFNFNYRPYQANFFNNGNFFSLTGSRNNTFDYNGVLYFLSRVEFHSPSEHTINGYRYDLEMELIHESGIAGSKLLAVSVFFDRGDKHVNCSQTNFFLESLQFNLPQFSTPRCTPEQWNGRFDCCIPNCTLPICGNGLLERGEQCDNGKNNSDTLPGACRTNCMFSACGDKVVDQYEECDDGNFKNGDGCTSTCRNECGNGVRNPATGEQCDNGAANSNTAANACRLNCRTAYCGDGVVDQGEQCDNRTSGNGNNPGQCRSNCKLPTCGDGILDPLEQCDLGAQNGPSSTCTSTCESLCGDSKLQTGEECDYGADNNNNPNSMCRTNCKIPRCGDGIVDTTLNELCDHGGVPNRFCSADCKQLCGNGRVDANEQCDYGCSNSFAPNSCRPDCTLPVCGDGILDKGEECDNGRGNTNSSPGACRINCTLPACGDSVVDPGEQCDNGRNTVGSGCNKCHTECGNGILDAGEECDYGALNSNTTADACRSDCRRPRCGDGILDRLETCDDGPRNGATPNTCRTDCSLPYCGDGIVDKAYGEYCDDGAANSDSALNGCSSSCLPNLCRQSPKVTGVNVDLNAALPKNKTAFAYDGSLTSPPCTEGVKWIIFPEIQFITQFQYDAFASSPYGYNSSSRPTQQLGWSRKIHRPFRASRPTCGNGIIEDGEECDLGFLRNSDKTSSLCRKDCTRPRCGDGVVDRSEECDDGYETARCTSTCSLKKVRFNPFVCPSWSHSATCKWSELCPAWATCDGTRSNARQSPINFDLSRAALNSLGRGKYALPAQYGKTAVTLINTGRVVSFLVNNTQSTLNINTTAYTLNRIDFHSPSEHTFNGQHATLEAQFIHTSASGETVAVSVLYNKARGSGLVRNQFLDQFWLFLPRDSDCRCGNGVIDPSEQCDNGAQNSDSKPDHCRRNCLKPRCGDGVIDRWEECDDGFHNKNGSNSCKPGTCKKPFCGDGYVDAGEQCDPAVNGTACTRTCHLLCGNGVMDANEDCDNGPQNSNTVPNACRTSCKTATCGDNVVDSNEECDDGARGSSRCRSNCKKARCGDGVTDLYLGEECDGGNGCSPTCTRLCGNGQQDPEEDCDNGHANSNTDGNCRTNCKRPTCGDYIVDSATEQCDDGPAGSIYCTAGCRLLCGNGERTGAEECDDGKLNSDTKPNACRSTCRKPSCGDGVKDSGEECDFGAQNGNTSTSPCRANCLLPRCGDKIVDAQEQCDDGNLVNGDGCTATCWNECGNGRRDGNEECDDGEANANQPNACRLNCKRPFCGDGIVDSGEQCDDGSRNNDTAPNACRRSCTLPRRGDGVVDDLYGERCDSTSLNDFSGDCSTNNVPNTCRTFKAPANRVVDLSLAFDKTSAVFTYDGSSTAPPCSEGWKWFVFQKTQTLDEVQYERLVAYFPAGNSRGPQPINGRTFSYTATEPAVCGDGLAEKTEECDEGELNSNSPDSCRLNCKRPACGDGILDAGELCDDGVKNSASGPCGVNCKWAGFEGCAPGNKTCTAPGATTINVIFANLLSGAKCTGNCPSA